ncbi:hypothetical protein JI747_010400 [Chryseobacterium sp. RG1]|uniref:Lipoprotein n=1 Tax=Chryseobacterium tagetis TaxID=2801334 RepID=A0ABS8A0R7_9FLAO|nr:hypothetical protein [Chryseobacterium tagetis]MCA6067589.1 hypothetical protein [Chryseobacterium tagetis]
MMKILSILMVVLFCCACNNKSQEKKDAYFTTAKKNQGDNIVEIVLAKQLKQGSSKSIDEAGAELAKMPFELEELEASAEIAKNILLSNGFKELSDGDFDAKIKNIFGRIIDRNSNNPFLYINYFDKCDRNFITYSNNSVDYEGGYVDKKRKLFTDFYYIPEIIDYQKEYPALNNIESSKIIRSSGAQGTEVEIPHWKDVSNLKEQRNVNIKTIVARNMYLFNDNKTYVTWLITQDTFFIKMLVTKFGYTKEPKFNDLVMNDYLNNYQTSAAIGDVIFTRNCNGKLEIRTDLLKYIKEHTKSDENRLLTALENFGYALKDNKSFTADEKYKILAYIGNTVDPFYLNFAGINSGNAVWNAESVLYNSVVKDKNIISVFKKNNYYGLPDLKESLIRIQGIIEHSSE